MCLTLFKPLLCVHSLVRWTLITSFLPQEERAHGAAGAKAAAEALEPNPAQNKVRLHLYLKLYSEAASVYLKPIDLVFAFYYDG